MLPQFLIEVELGWPVELVSDFLCSHGPYATCLPWLASGDAHMLPELWVTASADAVEHYIVDQNEEFVMSSGPLGILGQSGWYTFERDVERFPSLAGWRGLRDPAVREYFGGTFYSFGLNSSGGTYWGTNTPQLMQSLGLNYDIVWLGESESVCWDDWAHRPTLGHN